MESLIKILFFLFISRSRAYKIRLYALSNRIYYSNAVGGFPGLLVIVNLLKSPALLAEIFTVNQGETEQLFSI